MVNHPYNANLYEWRGGREAEGAPLLREYRVYSSIGGSNPPLSANHAKTPCFMVFFFVRIRSTLRGKFPDMVKYLKNRNDDASPYRTTCTACGGAPCYGYLAI